jgi:hypothetical protein
MGENVFAKRVLVEEASSAATNLHAVLVSVKKDSAISKELEALAKNFASVDPFLSRTENVFHFRLAHSDYESHLRRVLQRSQQRQHSKV